MHNDRLVRFLNAVIEYGVERGVQEAHAGNKYAVVNWNNTIYTLLDLRDEIKASEECNAAQFINAHIHLEESRARTRLRTDATKSDGNDAIILPSDT
jgi:hypothetical protein